MVQKAALKWQIKWLLWEQFPRLPCRRHVDISLSGFRAEQQEEHLSEHFPPGVALSYKICFQVLQWAPYKHKWQVRSGEPPARLCPGCG